MDITFGEMKRTIIHLLGDDEDPLTGNESDYGDYGSALGGVTYNAELLKDSVHAALTALANRLWKQSVISYRQEGEDVVTLPPDLIDVDAVIDRETGIALPKIQLYTGGSIAADTNSNAWMLYPHGRISFVNDLGSEGVSMYYSATWTRPDLDDDFLEPPNIAAAAISFYAASYCLLRSATTNAQISQYDTKIDAGKPTDNPAQNMSDHFLRRYELELNRIPMMQKGTV